MCFQRFVKINYVRRTNIIGSSEKLLNFTWRGWKIQKKKKKVTARNFGYNKYLPRIHFKRYIVHSNAEYYWFYFVEHHTRKYYSWIALNDLTFTFHNKWQLYFYKSEIKFNLLTSVLLTRSTQFIFQN